MSPKLNRRFQEIGKKDGSYSAAESRKAAALESLFARRRGKRINDPGVDADRQAEIMTRVQEATHAQFDPERVSKRALAHYLGVSEDYDGAYHGWTVPDSPV